MSFRPVLVGLPLIVGLVALTGCAVSSDPDEGTTEAVDTAQQEIKGGYVDPNDQNVVGIYWATEGAICTGSLIAPNLVLSARHCVAQILKEIQGGVACGVTKFGANGNPGTFGVTTQQTMPFSEMGYHPVVEVVTPPDTAFCSNDISMLILGENIDPAEAKPLVPRVDTQIVKKDQYSAIGYGGTQDDGTGAGQRRRRDSLFTNCVSDECPDFLGATTNEWVGDQGICQGDSGGPAIDMQNRVIGITSRGTSGCQNPIYGDVFAWGQLIKDTAVHAAQVGGYPAPQWATGFPTDPQFSFPVGDACTQPADCASNSCVNDGKGEYCTRPCTDVATCPDGYTCDIGKLGVCLQIHEPEKPAPKTGGEVGGCTIALGDDADPTKPVPWFTGAGLLGLALVRRRKQR